MNGKRDDFQLADFNRCASLIELKRGKTKEIIDEVEEDFSRWPQVAKEIGIFIGESEGNSKEYS